jgi:hypothetical protein
MTIPNHVPQYLRKQYDLTVEHAKGDRVRLSDKSPIGTVIAVTRTTQLTWRDREKLRRSGSCTSWIGQQMILIRWANGREGGHSPDGGLKWQPAFWYKKVQA